MEICGEDDHFRGDKIEIAPLEISTELPSIEEAQFSGHVRTRDDIAKHFLKEPCGNVSYDELFDIAIRHAGKSAAKCFTSEAKEKHKQRYGNIAFIAGQAGIGKSTLSKRLVEELWDSNSSLFRVSKPDLIFFVRFRDVDYTSKIDLLQFLSPFITDISNNIDRKNVLKKLENSDGVYIIMDGLDEAAIDPNMNKPECFNIDSVTTAEIFIQNLIAGNILPRSKKLVTSRPRQFAQLPKEFKPNVMFNIQGLSEAALVQICENICDKNVTRRDEILGYLESHPDLKSYCYTPVICIMVMESLDKRYQAKKSNEDQPSEIDPSDETSIDTLSAIFVFVLTGWLIEKLERFNLKHKFQIKEISKLAYEGFLVGQFYFEEFDLEEAGVDFQNSTTFLNTRIPILKGTKVTYFSHLMWQEFFVAVMMRLYMSEEEFKLILSKLENDKYEVISRFLFGLCNDKTLYRPLNHAKAKELNTKLDRRNCKDMLKQFVLDKLKEFESIGKDASFDDGSYYFSILPKLFWVHEMQDDHFAKQAAAFLKENFSIVNSNILPCDIPCINYILRARGSLLNLKVEPAGFIGKCSNYFYEELHKTLTQNPNIKVSYCYGSYCHITCSL